MLKKLVRKGSFILAVPFNWTAGPARSGTLLVVMLKKRINVSGIFIFKELALGSLSILSLGLVLFELLAHPSTALIKTLAEVDFGIACLFLLDFAIGLMVATSPKQYWHDNWYFLLASIPLTDTLTETLRGLRVLSLFRLIRVGGHLGVKAHRRHNRRKAVLTR